MSNIHNNGENDNPVDDDLVELGNAYGRLPHEEPPELLDQAVLNSAHRAVEKKPHWMKFGWLHGLTTTAVFLLALSLIFNIREPVPDFENGVRLNESAGLQRDKAVKKHSADIKSEDQRMEMKENDEIRQDSLRSIPAPAAPQREVLGIAVGDHAKRPEADNDASANEPVLEELLMDEADSVVDTPEFEAISKRSRAAVATELSTSELETPAEIDAEIEQKLLAIIKLRESGDKAWKTELALFKKNYPDYPLPEELSD
ncbi:hypothetical protein ACFL1J_05390 [Pseudomonadota bacterium]